MSSQRTIGALFLLLAAGFLAPVFAAQEPEPAGYAMPASDFSALQSLIVARKALLGIETEEAGIQRDVDYRDAITSLTALYQLHGCLWAHDALAEVLAMEDAPRLRAGYSLDGRILAMVEPLDLRNEAFDDYHVFLVSMDSNSGQILRGQQDSSLVCELSDGRQVEAQSLDESHPLWKKIARAAHTYQPVGSLYPLSGFTFKQVFLVSDVPFDSISSVSLVWGPFKLVVPYYCTEVAPVG